jgi:hypothetical protein
MSVRYLFRPIATNPILGSASPIGRISPTLTDQPMTIIKPEAIRAA